MNIMDIEMIFKQGPQTLNVGKWNIEFLPFVRPSNAHKSPIVILGGAFQKFSSFKYEVSQLVKDFPVFLVDLPGQGESKQLAPELDFEDYAVLLRGWMDQLGIEKINLVSLSYGSATGYHFASLFPERCNKLVLGGSTPIIRASVRTLLEESLQTLEEGDMEKFASGVVLNLMNFSQKHWVENSDIIARAMFRKIKRLTDFEKEKYIENTKRLLSLGGLPKGPMCDTLVITGEFDNFTTPYEGYLVSQKCYNSGLAVVKGTDHLAPYEKKDVVSRLYRRFFNSQPLKRMKDVEFMEKKQYPKDRIRMEPRFLLNDVAFLDSGNGVFVPVNVIDINNFGCRLYTSFKDHKVIQENQSFILHFPENDIQIELILFEQGEKGHYRGIFKHCDMDKTRKFENFIDDLAQTSEVAWVA